MKLALGSLLAFFLAAPLFAQSPEEANPGILLSDLKLHELREDISPEDLEIYTAYQEAQQLEVEIVRMFREVRAAELTMVQRQTLKRSLESILMPLSKRADVDRAVLTTKATTAEDIKRYQEELSIVMQETDAIVSNAQNLLESLLEKDRPQASNREEAAQELQEPIRARQEPRQSEPRQAQESLAAEEAKGAREQWKKEQRERFEKQAEEELKKTELHLEKALEEIQAAREKLEKLAQVDVKIDEAENAVKAVVAKVKAMENVSKVDLKQAEEAMQTLREALAKVKATDASAKQEAQAATKEKTAAAVRQMEAARSSLAAASDAIRSLQALSSGGDGGGSSKIPQIQAMNKLAAAASGTWLDLTRQMRGESLEAVPNEISPGARPELWAGIEELERSPTARKFSAVTPKHVWIFIGDWYVLSRYDNEGRANIEKVYPPESIVDLNAQYLSEDGKILGWEYESYPPPHGCPLRLGILENLLLLHRTDFRGGNRSMVSHWQRRPLRPLDQRPAGLAQRQSPQRLVSSRGLP